MIRFNIISETGRRLPRKKIQMLMTIMDEEEEPPESTVNIIFVNDAAMADLNRRYRRRRGPTDVLSFNIDDVPGPQSVLGEIYISTDTAARNAVEAGVSFTREVLHLCCHGFLHLLGHDHDGDEDFHRMREREEHYLERTL